jgi:choice-of-anchor B domain-containing protein
LCRRLKLFRCSKYTNEKHGYRIFTTFAHHFIFPIIMRLILSIACLFAALCAHAQNTNVTFRSKTTYTGQVLSNIWGYAAGGKEYALIGAKNGMIVTDVTNPVSPVQITQIAGAASDWREIKTYLNYAYVATEGGGGLQIVNLANLPASNLAVTTYTGGGTTPGTLNTIHALQVDVAKGFLYLYGTNLVSGRALVFDLNGNPTAPVYKGYYNPVGYAHDGYVNNDTMYVGHINAGMVSIVDMTTKTAPLNQIGSTLATFNTPLNFSHNTWRYGNTLFTTDEKPNSTLAAYDISDWGNITLLDQIQSNPGSNSIVHNTYIKNGYAITSWYRDGFTITDVSRPANMVQVGNYDTYSGSGNGFNGAWGVYPYLPSGNILISNIDGTSATSGEMYVLTPTFQRGCYIEGVVTDATTGNPINGAKAELLSTTTTNNSNAVGSYKMGQLASGTYTLRISKTGYTAFTQSVTIANGVLTTVNAALVPGTGCTYSTHNSQNFDASWGIWTDGGTDCARVNNAAYANSGTYSISLRDNTTTSLMTTTIQNCASYSEMKVSFSFIAVSFDNSNEDFWLQVSTNGGSTYTTKADFNYGTQFTNGVRQNVTVTIPGPFTSTTRFRFRADASDDDDVVYIDDVVITGCAPVFFAGGNDEETNQTTADVLAETHLSSLQLNPNPAFDVVAVSFELPSEQKVQCHLLDLTGRLVQTSDYAATKGLNQIDLDVQQLPEGTYLVVLNTAAGTIARQLIVLK